MHYADGRVQSASERLPLHGVVQHPVSIAEGDVERVGGLALLPRKKVVAQCTKIPRPECTGVDRLKPKDALERVFLEMRNLRKAGFEGPQEGLLVEHFRPDQAGSELGRLLRAETANAIKRSRLNVPAPGRDGKRAPFALPFLPTGQNQRALSRDCLER